MTDRAADPVAMPPSRAPVLLGLDAAAWAVLIWLLFAALHPLVRLAFDINLGPADSLSLVTSQDLKVAYWTRQPPFYTWMIWASSQIFGPTPLAIQVVKYGLMLIGALGFFMAGLNATAQRASAAVGALMVMLVFNVGFTVHDQSTHSVGLIAGTGLLVWGYARLARTTSWTSYALIVVASLLAILSKHSAWIVVIALPLAFLMFRELRGAILSVRFAISFALILLASLPLVLFILEHRTAAVGHLSRTIDIAEAGSPLFNRLKGQALLIGGFVVLLGPLFVLAAVLFPEPTRRGLAQLPARMRARLAPGTDHSAALRAIFTALVLMLSVIAVGMLLSGAGKIPSRHLLVAAMTGAVLIGWMVPRAALTAGNLRKLVVLVMVLQAALLVSRGLGYALPGRPFCDRCNHMVPIKGLAVHFDALPPGTTVVTDDRNAAGNLRRHLPQLRFVLTNLPKTAAPERKPDVAGAQDRRCVLLLSTPLDALGALPSLGPAELKAAAQAAPLRVIDVPWAVEIDGERRVSRWWTTELAPSLTACG